MDTDACPSAFVINLPPISVGIRGQAHRRAEGRHVELDVHDFARRRVDEVRCPFPGASAASS
jgi:hypothetical protein